MKQFMDENFLLNSETAKMLFHKYAKDMPIFDFHNHLSAKEIYDDISYNNLTQLWLGGDHYKWRVLRAMGVNEQYVTGDGDDYLKFKYYTNTLQNLIGNPLYHWSHLELQRYFNIMTPLCSTTQDQIWEEVNKCLNEEKMTTRHLLAMQNVVALCTTDDPVDDLYYHKKLKEDNFKIQVLPAFRPDQMINIEKETFIDYMAKLKKVVGYPITSIDDLEKALIERLDYFKSAGCLLSDHSIENHFYAPVTKAEVNKILIKRLNNKALTKKELKQYKGYILIFLGKQYAKKEIVMQFHIGALRNNSTRCFKLTGADSGFDSMNDFNYASELSELFNVMDITNELPKVVLYPLNQKDNAMLISMAGNFNDGSIKGKMQFGVPWWFNDHKKGMEHHLENLSNMGVLSVFIGMLTDSRSFLSFPRHEYFRRILCNKIGEWVENGEYPYDEDYLKTLIENICFNNAQIFFNLSPQ